MMEKLQPAPIFYGEVGVRRRMATIKNPEGWLDEDYDRENPDGSLYGRRNYKETSYLSGMPDLEPGEYQSREDDAAPRQGDKGFEYYREYGLHEEAEQTAQGSPAMGDEATQDRPATTSDEAPHRQGNGSLAANNDDGDDDGDAIEDGDDVPIERDADAAFDDLTTSIEDAAHIPDRDQMFGADTRLISPDQTSGWSGDDEERIKGDRDFTHDATDDLAQVGMLSGTLREESAPAGAQPTPVRKRLDDDFDAADDKDLKRRATVLGISGRETMSRLQLINAIRRAMSLS
jgi:hypothetical protein